MHKYEGKKNGTCLQHCPFWSFSCCVQHSDSVLRQTAWAKNRSQTQAQAAACGSWVPAPPPPSLGLLLSEKFIDQIVFTCCPKFITPLGWSLFLFV